MNIIELQRVLADYIKEYGPDIEVNCGGVVSISGKTQTPSNTMTFIVKEKGDGR